MKKKNSENLDFHLGRKTNQIIKKTKTEKQKRKDAVKERGAQKVMNG